MSKELKAALRERLDQNYNTFLESLQGKTASELIAMAPEITAAQQLHEELLDACGEEDMAFLLQFADPLEMVRGYWESEITGYAHGDEMGHMLWDIQDKKMYSEEQLIQPPNDIGEPSERGENSMSNGPQNKAVQEISVDDLRKMEGQEGLVLQGCGGSIQEWVDGINGLLTEAGILQDGSKFENVSVFQHGNVTCLLFPFEDVKLDVGKLAMWRIQTHEQFGGTWLSDYVPNRLGGFVREAPRQKPTMSLLGMDGNIFVVMGRASALLKDAGMGDLVDHMVQRVTTCGDYHKALNIISEYVETELSPPAMPKKSTKKKGRNAHER